jgi:hypothetical protein
LNQIIFDTGVHVTRENSVVTKHSVVFKELSPNLTGSGI